MTLLELISYKLLERKRNNSVAKGRCHWTGQSGLDVQKSHGRKRPNDHRNSISCFLISIDFNMPVHTYKYVRK